MRRAILTSVGLGLLLVLAISAAAAVTAPARRVHAQSVVQNSATEPACTPTPDVAAKFLSVQGGARSVTSDAQWQTALNTIFSGTNWPGVDPTALAFLRQLIFNQYHFTPPVP